MNKLIIGFLIPAFLLLASGCNGRGSSGNPSALEADSISVPDTGYTGIKQYYSGTKIVKEVTFRNGIKHGETRTYYPGGQLYQTLWYENGLREDSSKWYYLEGQVFRSTPYERDTIDGTQIQYYRNGKIKARLGYLNGFRTPLLEEFAPNGSLVRNYPEITYTLDDNYSAAGRVRVNLAMSDNSEKVKFYRGEFLNGVFDSTRCESIKTVNGKALLDLKKTGSAEQGFVGIIASARTAFGNNNLIYKRIELPYNDLK
ncbi:MAG: hypothetical protein RBT38_03310 [Bacteroidales bacterium]|jgi:hypothetical protein|nr:hypothetical protein [Bacteroidales bacterium]